MSTIEKNRLSPMLQPKLDTYGIIVCCLVFIGAIAILFGSYVIFKVYSNPDAILGYVLWNASIDIAWPCVLLSTIGAVKIITRKIGGIFICKMYALLCIAISIWNGLFYCLTSEVLLLFPIWCVIYAIVLLCMLTFPKDLEVSFPKEFRRHTTFDEMVSAVCAGVVLLAYLLDIGFIILTLLW
jgi:hypothetical protein